MLLKPQEKPQNERNGKYKDRRSTSLEIAAIEIGQKAKKHRWRRSISKTHRSSRCRGGKAKKRRRRRSISKNSRDAENRRKPNREPPFRRWAQEGSRKAIKRGLQWAIYSPSPKEKEIRIRAQDSGARIRPGLSLYAPCHAPASKLRPGPANRSAAHTGSLV